MTGDPDIDWRTCRYVALDLEGTASPAGSPEGAVEVAAVEIAPAAGRPLASFCRLVNPGVPISWRATRIHGLRDGDVADAPCLEALCPHLSPLVDGAVLVAHNARVDWALLQRHCHELEPLVVLDTLKLSRLLYSDLARHSLDDLVATLHVDLPSMGGAGRGRRHTALYDALTVSALFRHLLGTIDERRQDAAELLPRCVVWGAGRASRPEGQLDLFKGG